MDIKELARLISAAELRNPNVFNASRERYVAEISFRAGIREVAEWINANVNWRKDAPYKSTIDPDAWQSQQICWGLK